MYFVTYVFFVFFVLLVRVPLRAGDLEGLLGGLLTPHTSHLGLEQVSHSMGEGVWRWGSFGFSECWLCNNNRWPGGVWDIKETVHSPRKINSSSSKERKGMGKYLMRHSRHLWKPLYLFSQRPLPLGHSQGFLPPVFPSSCQLGNYLRFVYFILHVCTLLACTHIYMQHVCT